MRYLALLLALLISTSAFSAVEERVGIDPMLRGVWTIYATSDDGGKTTDVADQPFDIGTCRASSLTFADGTVVTFEMVMVGEDDAGNPNNGVMLSTGVLMIVSKNPDKRFYLAQFFNIDGETAVETARWVFDVN